MASLTFGAIAAFAQNRDVSNPNVQVVDIKRIESNGNAANAKERYRLIISDGQHYSQAMLSTQLNEMVKTNQLQTNCVVKLCEYICNEVQGRNIVIILKLEITGKLAGKQGNPVNIENNAQTLGGNNNTSGGNNQGYNNNQGQQQQFNNAPPAQQNFQQGAYNAPHAKHPQQPARQYAPPPSNNQYNNNNFQGNGPVVKQPMMSNNTHQGGASNDAHLVPIRALNPYQNRWTFKARVTQKGDMKTWDKGGTNKGKLFSMSCVDKEGTEIRCTFFKEAADQWYDALVPGEVFLFSKGQVKMANKQFNNTNNDYEITFGANCEINPCANDATIKSVSIDPTAIASIDPSNGIIHVDVVGTVVDFTELQEFTSKAGKPLTKMEVTLADTSNASVRVTLWGDKAREYSSALSQNQPNQIMAIKSAKVSDYNGCSLSSVGMSSILFNPEIPETQALRNWLANGGLNQQMTSKSQQTGGAGARAPKALTERHTLVSLDQNGIGQSEKGDYVDVNATIVYIKRENMWYAACPEEGENKKVVQQTDGSWFCEKTNKSYPNCEYRYILSCLISDVTGSRWVTCFNETGLAVLGNRTADDLESMKQNNEAAFDQVIVDSNFKTYNMCLRVKEETRDEETRLRCSLVRLSEVDYINESKQLVAAIEQYK